MKFRVDTLFKGRYKYDILFVIVFIMLSAIFYNGFTELNELPKGMHQWKQSIHFSMIQNYADGSASFWHPAMNNLFNSDNTGNLILEFPVFHKITALIIDVFPSISPSIFRWIMYLLSLIGFYHAYLLVYGIIKNRMLSVLASLLTFVTPVVVFYSASYLVDVPAMAFGFSAIYLMERNVQKWSFWNTSLAFLFLTLSGLLRLPVLILPFSYIGVRVIYRKKILQLLWVVPSLVLIIFWYYFVKKYNTYYVAYPPIETYNHLSPEKLSNTFSAISKFIIYQLGWSYRYFVFYLLVALYLVINWKLVSRFWFSVLFFSILGSSIYVYLWFGIFEQHDYYLFPVIPIILLIWLNVFFVTLRSNYIKHMFYFALIVLGINSLNTFDNMRLRTYRKSFKATHIFTGNFETGIWWYFGKENTEKWSCLREFSPYEGSTVFQENGIFRNDTVICDFDPAPTYSLALLQLKGWTLYNSSFSSIDDYVKYTKFGARFLVSNVNVISNLDSLSLSILHSKPIFSAGSLMVYDIRHLRNP